MFKKLSQVLVLLLAVNFLAVAGGVGWLWQRGQLGKEKVDAIREIVFPTTAPTSQPAVVDEPVAASQPAPLLKLEEMLAKASGRTAADQVAALQESFDAQVGQLDRRRRELDDLQNQVDLAKAQLTRDRAAQEAKEKKLADEQQSQTKLAEDKGFQDSLKLYSNMPAKQVKGVFMGLDDEIVVRYLQAMSPRTASKIVKEFKTPDETGRIQRVLEKMRLNQASAGG